MSFYGEGGGNMAVFLISYDLIAPGQHYPQVHEAIKAINPNSWAKPLESVWLVKSELTAPNVRDKVMPAMDQNDKLMVIEITKDLVAAWNLSDKVWAWIEKNV